MHKRILLAATGLTPQVVTETLYALATAPEAERFIPDELHVITTLRGAELVKLLFMGEHANQLEALCRQWSIPMPRVLLHVLGTKDAPLDDLRSAADNEAAANSILEVVRTLTRDDATAIHFSIAGGRKTMGYYLGTCASILGRPQDRMSHVLVNEPFESASEFFFPPNPPTHMLIRSRPTDSTLARVALAPVSFVRLRPLLPAPLICRGSFTRLVAVVDSILANHRLVLRIVRTGDGGGEPDPASGGAQWRGEVEVGGGLRFALPPKSFAMYWLLARQAARGTPWVSRSNDARVVQQDFLAIYRMLAGLGARYDQLDAAFAASPGQFLRTEYQNAMSRLSAHLKKELGDMAARVYGPHKEGTGERLRHRLKLPSDAIRLEAPAADH